VQFASAKTFPRATLSDSTTGVGVLAQEASALIAAAAIKYLIKILPSMT
jgi:hypothetical protein|tara:strand:- start:33008 stop:33154 length:147 start_codon:yes stop_codon:yes gene_type:complete